MLAQANPSSTESPWLISESYAGFSSQSVDVSQRETHPNHHEENTGGAKNSLGWYDVHDPTCKVQGIDGEIQRRDDVVSTFPLFGLDIHGSKVDVAQENADAGRL